MRKLLLLLLIPILFSCSKNDDEANADSQIFLSARYGTSSIDAVHYIFRGKDYDPKTFTRSSPAAIICKIVNSKGDSISSIGLAYSKAKEGVVTFIIEPGDYFVVTAPFGFKPSSYVFMNLWKAKAVTIEGGKDVTIVPVFKSLYSTGYVEWDE